MTVFPLPEFLTSATPASYDIMPVACSSETCTGQGCVSVESGCDSDGCQSCMCVYESGQCGQCSSSMSCGQSCSQSCSEHCSEYCNSETCTGQGCTQCESSCESDGCQSCMCVYESGQCGQCGQSCHECYEDDCGEECMESPIGVDYWDWNASNGSASATRTKAAYRAVRDNGEVSDFHYLVWNDLVDKIYEVKQYAGFDWNAKFDLYANTRMTSTDKVLTALRFNSARYNIGIHISTGIDDVRRGDDVMGDYFLTIADCINEFIDSLA